MISTIIFDLDGVLIDATEWHYEALNEALGLFGYEIKREDHISIYNGLPTSEKLKVLSDKHGLPLELHEVIKEMKRIYTDERVERLCHPSYDKQLMLLQLKKRGFRLACCSNAQKYSVMNMLRRSQIDSYFELIIGNDEGFRPKPAPDIYLTAFERLSVKPQEVVIVEDAPHGIEAAKASGAKVIEVKGYEEVNMSLFEGLDSDSKVEKRRIEESRQILDSKVEKRRIEEFTRGWFIGDFNPSFLKTNDFEIGVKNYKKGEKEEKHYHKIAKEYTVILEGRFKMNSKVLKKSDIVLIEPNKKVAFECIEKGYTLVIKTPSVKEDKYICE